MKRNEAYKAVLSEKRDEKEQTMRHAVLKLAMGQMLVEGGKPADNLQRAVEMISDASAQDCDIIILPECLDVGWTHPSATELADEIPGSRSDVLCKAAADQRIYVVAGLTERDGDSVYNSAVLIDPQGEIITTYHKVHLRGEERLAFRPGYRFVLGETSFGLLGLLIGWDLAFPEAARCLTLQGAELLCLCANWEQPHTDAWRHYVFARALENSVFMAAANRVGEEYSYSFCGSSLIVGPRGEVYNTMEQGVEGYGLATIDLDEVRKNREDTQLLQIRQPRSYREIVKMY